MGMLGIMMRIRNLATGLSAIVVFGWMTIASATEPDRNYNFLSSGSYIQDKNFYFFTLIQSVPEVRSAVTAKADLAQIAASRWQRIQYADAECDEELQCFIDAIKFSEAEISAASEALASLANGEAVRHLVDAHMRPSGAFIRHANETDAALVAAAWVDAARAINRIADVYGLGVAPRYPAIDSLSVPVDSRGHILAVRSIIGALVDGEQEHLFFEAGLTAALDLLYLNERGEAGLFEPLASGENRAAKDAVPSTKWAKFPYSSILVLGDGPELPNVALGSLGKMRLRLAARRFNDGLAPFIIVSGGSVHPVHTPINEALEMKRELMSRYEIPESAIIIEPHARHTTTNFRNAARLMFRHGIPMNKPAMATTTRGQSAYVTRDEFKQRCLNELGYLPLEIHGRASQFDVVFTPNILSLHLDASDPLDP